MPSDARLGQRFGASSYSHKVDVSKSTVLPPIKSASDHHETPRERSGSKSAVSTYKNKSLGVSKTPS